MGTIYANCLQVALEDVVLTRQGDYYHASCQFWNHTKIFACDCNCACRSDSSDYVTCLASGHELDMVLAECALSSFLEQRLHVLITRDFMDQ